MNVFFLELWHDLREKRLVPVAVVLLLALVTVPAVMLKSSSASSDGAGLPPAQKAQSVDGLLPVQLASDDGKGSGLKTFDPKNPFKPGVKLSAADAASVVSRTEGSVAGNAGGAEGLGQGQENGGGNAGGNSGGSPSTGVQTPTTPKTRTARFTYVIDVTFVKNGRVTKRKGLRRLAMLPSQAAPLLIFLGVDNGADNALFMVDSTLKTFGEGTCKPSKSECGVLSLGSGAEHEFTDADDNSYGIRIDEIRRVSATRAARAAARASKAARSSTSAGPTRRFVPPFLTDIEKETTTGAER